MKDFEAAPAMPSRPANVQRLCEELRDIIDQALMHGIAVRAGRIMTDVARDHARDERAGIEKHEVAGIGDANNLGHPGEQRRKIRGIETGLKNLVLIGLIETDRDADRAETVLIEQA